jgi:hypothetical protein
VDPNYKVDVMAKNRQTLLAANILAMVVISLVFASGSPAADFDNYSKQLDGWAFSKSSNPDTFQLFVDEEKKNIGFGFLCSRNGARQYWFFDPTMKRTSQTSCQTRIAQLDCDGEIVQSIKYCEESGGISLASVREIPNEDAFFAGKEPPSVVETDRNVLTAIASAKRFCSSILAMKSSIFL